MELGLQADLATISRISAVPTILEAVSELTGLGFVCVARVTADSWHSCAVLDRLNFGLRVGDSLDVTTTLCEEVRDTNSAIIIDSVRDCEKYRDHHTPRIYGFQSYFSIPLYRPNGEYFGTLCGLDPAAASLTNKVTTNTLTLFAELISRQLANEVTLNETQTALSNANETAELREQFIAVLGHDLRTPLGAVVNGIEVLRLRLPDAYVPLLNIMDRSCARIACLINDVTDFTRGRMGGGISLNLRDEVNLHRTFTQVIDELKEIHPDRQILASIADDIQLHCDPVRMGQLLSNLVKNAIVHGAAAEPVEVRIGLGGDGFELSVTNGGPALQSDVISQLFKPFWRAKSGKTKEGLGLGLFIVSEIAKSHGGTLRVTSSDTATSFIYRVQR
jgi:signal transduction histidine kinase